MEFTKTVDENGIYRVSNGEFYLDFDSSKCNELSELEDALQQMGGYIREASEEMASLRMAQELLKDVHDIPENKKHLIRSPEDIEWYRAFYAMTDAEKEATAKRMLKEFENAR